MDPATESPETIEWRIFLLGRHPRLGAMAIGVCGLTIWFIQSLGQSAWITGVALFVLLGSLSNFLFPTHYRLDATHVLVRNPFYRRRRAWTEFRAHSRAGDRVNLRTLPHESRLDHYRGMLIILDPERREEIMEFLLRHIGEAKNGAS